MGLERLVRGTRLSNGDVHLIGWFAPLRRLTS
jgi:hypothetical protein